VTDTLLPSDILPLTLNCWAWPLLAETVAGLNVIELSVGARRENRDGEGIQLQTELAGQHRDRWSATKVRGVWRVENQLDVMGATANA
jgi:hypothetical protein